MTDYTAILDTQIEPDAPLTATLAGQFRDNPIAIAEGSSGAPSIVYAALENLIRPIGVGQTWQDVSASRSYGTSYQNTHLRPIGVSVSWSRTVSGGPEVSSDGSTWLELGTFTNGNLFFIVPVDWYYRVVLSGSPLIHEWKELS